MSRFRLFDLKKKASEMNFGSFFIWEIAITYGQPQGIICERPYYCTRVSEFHIDFS